MPAAQVLFPIKVLLQFPFNGGRASTTYSQSETKIGDPDRRSYPCPNKNRCALLHMKMYYNLRLNPVYEMNS